MKFLNEEQVVEQCRLLGGPAPSSVRDRLPDYSRYSFKIPEDAGARVALCRTLWGFADGPSALPRLLYFDGWSAWPSGEHMPLFTRLRAALGEARDLIEIPGVLLEPGDGDDGLSMWVLACLFLWDALLYFDDGLIVGLTNDEMGDVYERKGAIRPAHRAALAALKVLV